MPTPTKEIVGFTFQEIPLDEARNAVLAGDGNYSEIKQTLLEKLPTLAPDKAFAFGLPNGQEVPENQRRGLCMAINATLKRAKIEWRITYSGMRKLFLCVPKSRTIPKQENVKKDPTNGYVPRSILNDVAIEKEIFALRDQGLKVREIVAKGYPKYRVTYICYQKYPHRKALISNRIKEGLAKAKENGVVPGRPRAKIDVDQIKALHDQGHGVREIARLVNAHRNTIGRILGGTYR